MTFDEKQVKYLEMIQTIVNRMASNSFQLKALFVTLLTALLALLFNIDVLQTNKCLVNYLLVLIALIFWILDSYYLSLERKYRNLYNNVIEISKEQEILFFDLTSVSSKKNIGKLVDTRLLTCIFLKSTVFFYLPIVTVILLIIKFIIFK